MHDDASKPIGLSSGSFTLRESLFDESLDQSRKSLDDLISRSLAYRTGSELKDLLDFARKFPHVAPFNAMLLHVQNPGIGYALTAPDWERKYGRRVKPAVRPYVILRTMGPVAFVFDLSDTEPLDSKDVRIPPIVKNPFPTRGEPPIGALGKLTTTCSKVGIEVEARDYGTNLAGRVQRVPGKPHDFHIALNSKHTEAQKIGTLAHELAHIFCGHQGSTEAGFWPDRRDLPLQVREFEAEAVAYLITDRFNLDIGSVSYLSGYLKDPQALPNYSLDTVLKATGKIEEMISGRFRVRKKPQRA